MRVFFLIALLFVSSIGRADRKLVFSDEFNFLDEAKWSMWCENEERHDTLSSKEAVVVKNGCLEIRPFTRDGKHYSALLCTQNSFKFHYGYIEIKVKFNTAPSCFSDAWLFSEKMMNKATEIGSSEVDLFEHRARDETKDTSKFVCHSLHWSGYDINYRNDAAEGYLYGEDDFHVISLLWKYNEYIFSVDGRETWRTSEGLTKNDMFLILSVESKNNWWAGVREGDFDGSPMMTIDYIHIYELTDEEKR